MTSDNKFQNNIFSKLMNDKKRTESNEKNSTTFQSKIFASLMDDSKADDSTSKDKDIELAIEVSNTPSKNYVNNIFANLKMNEDERIDNLYTNSIFKNLKNSKVYSVGYFVSYESEAFIADLISLFAESRFSNYSLNIFFDTVNSENNGMPFSKGKINFTYDYKSDISEIEDKFLSKNKLDLVVTTENSEDGIEIVKRSLKNEIPVLTISSNHINELIKNNIELLGTYLTIADDEQSILKKLNYILPTLKES